MNLRSIICHKLGRCKKKKIIISLIVCFLLLTCACTAFAADAVNPLAEAQLTGNDGPLSSFYNFFYMISIPMAVIGLVLCFLSFIISKEKERDVAKKRMLYIGLAIIVISSIPKIVDFAFENSLIKSNGWKAGEKNAQIVAPAQQNGEGNILNTLSEQLNGVQEENKNKESNNDENSGNNTNSGNGGNSSSNNNNTNNNEETEEENPYSGRQRESSNTQQTDPVSGRRRE